MKLRSEVIVVSSIPVLSWAVKQILQTGPRGATCRILAERELVGTPGPARYDVVLLAPQNWEEMARWLPFLRQSLTSSPWLLLADLRLAGMFLSLLERQPCAVLAPGASPEELRVRLRALAGGRVGSPASAVRSLFNRGAAPLTDGTAPDPLTPRELQCGCAVSLGLSNRQISEILHLGECTVKSHVHRLMEKLELSGRDELATYFQRALTPFSPPLPWTSVPMKRWRRITPAVRAAGSDRQTERARPQISQRKRIEDGRILKR